ncbi:hypothetical protein EJK17_09895 [Lactobacillus xujianguonis]|uniref:Uncharacterized protein n=1 Tax=Lactobacillus xujianguonis TaxID=2495899 RepID=A0A437ST60_9LACO|nr:hypothetical protein EJK17_09895 [Lactobacillus xujianguonis]
MNQSQDTTITGTIDTVEKVLRTITGQKLSIDMVKLSKGSNKIVITCDKPAKQTRFIRQLKIDDGGVLHAMGSV